MPHGNRDLPVAALEALHAGEGGAPEVLLKGGRDRVGAFRRQKPQLELLLVLDEVSCLQLYLIVYHWSIHYLFDPF